MDILYTRHVSKARMSPSFGTFLKCFCSSKEANFTLGHFKRTLGPFRDDVEVTYVTWHLMEMILHLPFDVDALYDQF
jgi:hypothetical protein